MDATPEWVEDVQMQIEAIRPHCPRLADIGSQWLSLASGWLKEERRLGSPSGKSADWLEQTGVPQVLETLRRALLDPDLARWLEAGIPEFGLGIYMAALKDHEEQGIWVVDFPSALGTLTRDFDRTEPGIEEWGSRDE